jgi:GWxTD domain-containing protein
MEDASVKRLAFVLLFMAGNSLGSAQALLRPERPLKVHLSYSRFFQNDTSKYVEINFGVYPALVTLVQKDSSFHGAVEIYLAVRPRETNDILHAERLLLPVVVKDTSFGASHGLRVGRTGCTLPIGQYRLSVLAIDSLNRQRRDSTVLDVTIDKMSSSPSLSDVDLCTTILSSTNKQNPFYKNSYEVVPNPSMFYGSHSAPVVYSYLEVYHVRLDAVYRIRIQIIDDAGKVLKEGVRNRMYKAENVVDVSTLNVPPIASGRYRFQAILTDTSGKEFARSERFIYIHNPTVQEPPGVRILAQSAEFAGMSGEELDDEFRKAQYLHRPDDAKRYKQLTSAEAKRGFIAQFWIEVESGNRGIAEMNRSTWFQRISLANQRYGSLNKEGWRTDRGRVLVLYGQPDEIKRFPSSIESKPYEIWHYYNIENGVEFDFVDQSGFGNYLLLNSTKRGETQDAQWQRFLQ